MGGLSNMTTTYTNIPKPVGTAYGRVNAIGKEQYDQSDIAYDSASTFYDGVNMSMYTSVSKPVGTAYTNIPKP